MEHSAYRPKFKIVLGQGRKSFELRENGINGEGKILSANSSLQNVKCEKREGTPQLAHSVR